MWVREIFKTLVILGSVSAVLLGCRAEERDRFVYYEPGKYKGQPDSVLSQEQRKILRQRTIYQGTGMASGGGMLASPGKSVRKPSNRNDNLQKLKNRVRVQMGTGTN